MSIKIAFLFSCTLLFSAAYADNIYTWVDENGGTHVSNIVPPRYQGVATKVDTSGSKVSEQERQQALQRVAREKQAVQANSAALPNNQSAEGADMVVPRETSSPTANNGGGNDCASRMAAYRRSQECFAPYMRVDGGISQDAYRNCVSVADPSSECGVQPELSAD